MVDQHSPLDEQAAAESYNATFIGGKGSMGAGFPMFCKGFVRGAKWAITDRAQLVAELTKQKAIVTALNQYIDAIQEPK